MMAATVEVRITVVCSTEAERDELKAAMDAEGVGSNFASCTTPTSTTIALERDDTVELVGGDLVYTHVLP